MHKLIDAIIFDCDGTLSTIEGITELAKLNAQEESVQKITEVAMAKTGLNPEIYKKRLDIVLPTKQQCSEVAEHYIATVTPDVKDVIKELQENNITVFIMSAGVDACVLPFVDFLGVPKEQCYSVPIYFNEDGSYKSFDSNCPLTNNDGKFIIAKELQQKYRKMIAVGDGMNDISLKPIVKKFIGFGGAFYRESIKVMSDVYIKENSMLPVLTHCLQK